MIVICIYRGDMKNEVDYIPLLEAGFSYLKLDEVKNICVDAFGSENYRRVEIWNGFTSFIDRLCGFKLKFTVWVDGSFVTSKLEPNDIDFLVIFDYAEFSSIPKKKREELGMMFTTKIFRSIYFCDAYMEVTDKDSDRPLLERHSYWLGLFSYDRNLNVKGIICLEFGGKK